MKDLLYLKDEQIKDFIQLLFYAYRETFADPKEILSKKEQLFLYLVGTFHSSAKIALGKIENPMTKTKDLNLEQASFYIDLLDLVQEKTKDNLSDYEEQMLINTISELKMNLIDEKKNNGNKNGQKTNKD